MLPIQIAGMITFVKISADLSWLLDSLNNIGWKVQQGCAEIFEIKVIVEKQ